MELHYLRFLRVGHVYYEDAPDVGLDYPRAAAPWPEDWVTRADGQWFFAQPADQELRGQGWKIHVSSTVEDAPKVLDLVSEYCLEHRVPFKFIRSPAVLLQRNSKYGDRSASGKFVTVYPADDAHLALLLEELDDALRGFRGPYVLSDLRWREGPLYVRYGAFVLRYGPDEHGRPVPCVVDPDGNLVPDQRRPGFHPPPWAEVPACLDEAIAARAAGTLRDFPYRARRALHFSNGGGVYLAEDLRDGRTVLMKEARPYAGLDEAGTDAVARLENERATLERLAGVPGVPALLDFRRGHEHWFLVREFVEGEPLGAVLHRRSPLVTGDDDPAAAEAWTRTALDVLAQVRVALDAMHERGVVFADLHPGNLILGPDGRVGFIDLESASLADDAAPQRIGAAGYRAPLSVTGTDVDEYAFACLTLGVLLPLTVLVPWSATTARRLRDAVVAELGLPADFGEDALAVLERFGHDGVTEPDPAVVTSFADPDRWRAHGRPALLAAADRAATPERHDRLHPGDVQQLLVPGGGVTLAFGAAGSVWAALVGGHAVPEAHVRWFVDRVREPLDLGPGLWDGWTGIAHVLRLLGRPDEARAALDRAMRVPPPAGDPGLYRGLAGVGLELVARAAAADDADATRAADVAELVGRAVTALPAAPGVPGGLMYGAAGPALLEIHLHRLSPDDARLDRARTYLLGDLARTGYGVPQDGPEAPWRSPQLLAGGPGLALAVREYLAERDDPVLAGFVRDVCAAVGLGATTHAGLLRGRAGTLLALTALARTPGFAGTDGHAATSAAIGRQLTALSWHVGAGPDGPALLGDHGLRLSHDLGSGTAGVVHAVDVAHGLRTTTLPFLGPVGTEHPPGTRSTDGPGGTSGPGATA